MMCQEHTYSLAVESLLQTMADARSVSKESEEADEGNDGEGNGVVETDIEAGGTGEGTIEERWRESRCYSVQALQDLCCQ